MEKHVAVQLLVCLASSVRLNIVGILLESVDGLSAGEIGDAAGLTSSTLSSHLAQLLTAGLVARRKSGRALIYSAVPGALAELRRFLETLERSTDDPRGLKLVTIPLESAGLIGMRPTLQKNNLPVDDLGGEGQRYFSLLDASGSAYGYGGLEGAGADQLLRSLIIYPEVRGTGLGRALVRLLERQAREDGAQRVWLLTNDAEKYFRRLGYKTVDRAQAPKAITRMKQFAALCPASARLMRKELRT